ncbi:MAG: HAMP domain-containing sensor histidine kinase [Opitutus sp.]
MLTAAPGYPPIFRLPGPPDYNAVTTAAVRSVFANTAIVDRSEAAALPRAHYTQTGGALLIACDLAPDTLAELRKASDASDLPRWAIILLRTSPIAALDPDPVDRADWNEPLIARVVRSSWQHLELVRAHARLRGNLATFGTRIAHDLRTPLGGVLTTAEMLREILAEDAPADMPLVQPILDSTEGLVSLIERASFFARASSSQEPARVLDMFTPFWNAFQQLEGRLNKSQTALTYPSAWPKVQGHENGLEAAWRTLLANAIQHGKPGTNIEAGWTTEGEGTRFFVRNEGTVSPGKQSEMFFPFHRLHEPGAPRGLGLAIVRELVEHDHGYCQFIALEDGRVEFSFVLPTRLESTAAPRTTGGRE